MQGASGTRLEPPVIVTCFRTKSDLQVFQPNDRPMQGASGTRRCNGLPLPVAKRRNPTAFQGGIFFEKFLHVCANFSLSKTNKNKKIPPRKAGYNFGSKFSKMMLSQCGRTWRYSSWLLIVHARSGRFLYLLT